MDPILDPILDPCHFCCCCCCYFCCCCWKFGILTGLLDCLANEFGDTEPSSIDGRKQPRRKPLARGAIGGHSVGGFGGHSSGGSTGGAGPPEFLHARPPGAQSAAAAVGGGGGLLLQRQRIPFRKREPIPVGFRVRVPAGQQPATLAGAVDAQPPPHASASSFPPISGNLDFLLSHFYCCRS